MISNLYVNKKTSKQQSKYLVRDADDSKGTSADNFVTLAILFDESGRGD